MSALGADFLVLACDSHLALAPHTGPWGPGLWWARPSRCPASWDENLALGKGPSRQQELLEAEGGDPGAALPLLLCGATNWEGVWLALCSLRRHLVTVPAASEAPGAPEGASWGLVPGRGGEGMDGAWVPVFRHSGPGVLWAA